MLLGIFPREGPRSGGTNIVIKGLDLDAGSDVTIEIDGGSCILLK